MDGGRWERRECSLSVGRVESMGIVVLGCRRKASDSGGWDLDCG